MKDYKMNLSTNEHFFLLKQTVSNLSWMIKKKSKTIYNLLHCEEARKKIFTKLIKERFIIHSIQLLHWNFAVDLAKNLGKENVSMHLACFEFVAACS